MRKKVNRNKSRWHHFYYKIFKKNNWDRISYLWDDQCSIDDELYEIFPNIFDVQQTDVGTFWDKGGRTPSSLVPTKEDNR